MSNTFNFDALTSVETRNPRNSGHSSSYDLRYSTKRNKFMIGSTFWEKNDLDNQGMTVFHGVGQPVFIGISDEEHAKFLTRKKGAKTKTKEFTHKTLRKLLDERDITTTDVNLINEGQHGEYEMFRVEKDDLSGDIYVEEDQPEDSSNELVSNEADEELVSNNESEVETASQFV